MTVVRPSNSHSGSFKLTPSQHTAINGMAQWYQAGPKYARLIGPPGSGKTALQGEFLRWIRDTYEYPTHRPAFLFTAPTHAAVRVGQAALVRAGISNLDCCTIQSFCGLRQKTAADGRQSYYKQPNHTPFHASNPNLRLLIIDEASMIEEELLGYIEETLRSVGTNKGVKVLFVGDTGQLPPVGEAESAPLTKSGIQTFELTEVVRHGGPILDLAIETRNLMLGRPELTICEDGPIVVTNSQVKWNSMFRDALADTGNNTLGLIQAYAYRNDEVARLNNMARRKLYGNDIPRIIKGEMLISTATISTGGSSGFEGIVAPSTTRMRVTDVVVETIYATRNRWIKVYQIEAYSPDMDATLFFSVVHEEDRPWFKQHLDELAKWIKTLPPAKAKQRWANEFFPLKNWDAPVTSACATTVHRAQGSTVEKVFLQVDDIDRVRHDPRLWNRLFYTGLTRASKQIIIRNLSARHA